MCQTNGEGIADGRPRDFLAELFDQFDQQEQARIAAAEDIARRIFAQGTAVRNRVQAAGSTAASDWLLEPDDVDAAGDVFAAYVNGIWWQTDVTRSESIQQFLATVDKLVDPVLTRYGRESESWIDTQRGQCQVTVRLILKSGMASVGSNAVEQTETGKPQLSGSNNLVISFKPHEILESSESRRIRQRRNKDLEAAYARRRRNPYECGREEERLKSARSWAQAELRELVPEAKNLSELKERVVKKTFDKFIGKNSYFRARYQEFALALWEEGWPSLEKRAIVAIRERAASADGKMEPTISQQAEPVTGSAPGKPVALGNEGNVSLSTRDSIVHKIVGERNFTNLTNAEIMKARRLGPRLRKECDLKPGDAAKCCLDRIRNANRYPLSGAITKKRSVEK